MKRKYRVWTSLIVMLSMVISLLAPLSVFADAPRITITSMYTGTNTSTNLPQNDNFVSRYTSNPTSITATIENISDSEVSKIYYEITNVTTSITTVEQANPPLHAPGSFDITFRNVILADGLNKVTIKLGSGSVVASAPGWAYFTPTTNIANFTINDAPFNPNKMYPDNPAVGGTALAIKGNAANATEVKASILGNPSVRNAYLNNGNFLLTADDINKRASTANFLLKPGDNLFTLIANNNSKSYTTQKNIIYDNGNPFAFNAVIYEDTTANPNAPPQSLNVNPTVNTSRVQIAATLKDDLDSLGNLKYRYVDVVAGGQRFGPYDLGSATPATTVSPMYPTLFTEGHSTTQVAVAGTALSTSNIKMEIEDKSGAITSIGMPSVVNSTNTMALFNLPAGSLVQANGPYKFRVYLNSGSNPILYQGAATVTKLSGPTPPPLVDFANFVTPSGLKQGYASAPYAVNFTTNISSYSGSVNSFKIDFTDLTGQTVYVTTRGKSITTATNTLDYDMPTGLVEGEYKVRVSYSGTVLTEKYMSVAAPNQASPVITQPGQPFTAAGMKGQSVGVVPTYFVVNGTNFGTVATNVTAAALIPALTASVSGGNLTLSSASTAPVGTVIKYVGGTIKAPVTTVTTAVYAVAYTAPIPVASLGANNHVSAAAIYPNGTASYFDFVLTSGALTSMPAASVTVNPYQAQGNNIIFQVPDQKSLDPGMLYDLTFTHSTNSTSLTAKAILLAKDPALFTSYGLESVTGTSLIQLQPSEIPTTPLTVSGQNLANKANVLVEFLSEDGNPTSYTATVNSVNNSTPASASASVALPNLINGNYLLRISYNNNVLATYPIAIVNPIMNNITPRTLQDTQVATGNQPMTISGMALGRDNTALKVRFQSDSDPSAPIFDQDVKAGTLQGGSKFQVDIPVVPVGTYSVSLLYNGNVMGTPLKFTVASAPAILKENTQWSRSNRYKAFDFAADLIIPTDRYQLVEFKFYNFVSDNVPPSSFTFSYIDPNSPYIDHVNRTLGGAEILLPEGITNEVNELPSSFMIYANSNTTKLNVYIGNYDGNSVPYKTIRTGDAGVLTNQADPIMNTGTYNVFPVTLNGIPNGITKITIVPAIKPPSDTDKAGENVGGKKQYDLTVSNTPYVIINNIFNGMTVKDQVSEINCNNGGTPVGRCISGRIVNVDLTSLSDIGPNYVQIELNGVPTRLLIGNIDMSNGTFYYQLPAALAEGKNSIKIRIFQNSSKTTESSYNVFVFSTTAPEVIVYKPVETTGQIQFTPGKTAGTYSTAAIAVSLTGQFVNATDIKLTARLKDENGNPVIKYDRRFGSSREPINGNPNFINSVDFVTGMFSTNAIPLSPKGDTIFELTVTNSSNVTVTKTITITREPLPYVITYPILSKNAKGAWQANINSNYIEIEMAAEYADSVVFGKDQAIKRQVIDDSNNQVTHFFYEVENLKAGNNTISFTVNRGTQKMNGSFILFNADTSVEGAKFKTPLKNSIKAFGNDLTLTFPKGTNLMRNDPNAVDQFLTADRKIVFGIASNDDGRVDKYKHPSPTDGQIGNPNPLIGSEGRLLLSEPTGRFRPAGEMFWIDAGTIANNETDRTKALTGSGRDPYDSSSPFYSRNQKEMVVPTERGTLTLSYDSNIRDDSWKYLTVYHFDIYEDYRGAVQPRWRNLGGVVNPANNTITVPFDTFGYYQVVYMDQSFDDVTEHPWARNELDILYSKGLMLNKTDTSFVPNDPISRGEFTTMLVKIFDIPLQYSDVPTFTDVLRYNPLTNGLYDYKYIETAAMTGIARGGGGGRFMPDASITRQDAAVMISRAADLKLGNDTSKSLVALQKLFTDANGIDVYARTAVEGVTKAGFIEGKENVLIQGQKKATLRFDPLESFTRAEAATVAIRVLQFKKKIPK